MPAGSLHVQVSRRLAELEQGPHVANLADICGPGPVTKLVKAVKEGSKDLRDYRVDIAFVGGFSSGKSTLINALLGRPFLPTGRGVVTQRPVWIRPGRHDDVGYWRDDQYIPRALGPWQSLCDRSRRLLGLAPLALPGPVPDWLSAGKHTWDSSARRHWYAIRCAEWPMGDRVTLIDTPGFNSEHPEHRALTLQALDEAEVAVIVEPPRGLAQDERDFVLDEVLPRTRSLAFVLNQMDLVDPEDVEELVERAKERAEREFGVPDAPILVCSARGATDPETGLEGWTEVSRWLEALAQHDAAHAAAQKVAVSMKSVLKDLDGAVKSEVANLENAARRVQIEAARWDVGADAEREIRRGKAPLHRSAARAIHAACDALELHRSKALRRVQEWLQRDDSDPTDEERVRMKLRSVFESLSTKMQAVVNTAGNETTESLNSWCQQTDMALLERWSELGLTGEMGASQSRTHQRQAAAVRDLELVDDLAEGGTVLAYTVAGAGIGTLIPIPGVGTLVGGALGLFAGTVMAILGGQQRAVNAVTEAAEQGCEELMRGYQRQLGTMEVQFGKDLDAAVQQRISKFRAALTAMVLQLENERHALAARRKLADSVRQSLRAHHDALEVLSRLPMGNRRVGADGPLDGGA